MREISENIVVAALALTGTLAGAYLGNRKSSALIAYRLEQLERRVQAHNNLVERTYRLEAKSELLGEDVKEAERRLRELEEEREERRK